ncbi:MAG: efflux RND transporter permease subunit [Phycisphaerae bacterium]
MKFTDLFIKRWVLACAVNLIILVLGLRAWMSMTTQEYPTITSTIVTVTTSYPGADPAQVQAYITSRLEQAVAQAPNIDYMTATSAESTSTVTCNMVLNSDPNAAVSQILAKVQQVASQLPPASQTPVINEETGDARALIYLAFSSKTMNQQQINDYLLRVVQPKIQSLPGVSQAQILPSGSGSSGNSFALRVWLRPAKLAALNLTPADVSAALASNNFVSAIGRIRGKNIAQVITANTSIHNLADFKNLVVKYVNGVPIRLSDVADVTMGAQNYNQSVFLNGVPATFIGVFPSPTANDLTLAHEVHVALRQIQANLPAGLHGAIGYDGSVYIKAAIAEVEHTLLITLGIVVLVIFLFLGSFRSLLIPVVAIPLAVIGAGLFMITFGFTINLLTLLAVILAIGLVVDDAIIMVENIHRHIDEGLTPLQAAFKGARELAGPIIVMSTTLAAVFAPIGFMGGLTGSLFTEFAFTLVFTVMVSMIVALTLSPMLSSKILKPASEHGLVHFLDSMFMKLRHGYERSLHTVLAFRWLVLVMALVLFVSIPLMLLETQSELAPTEDQGILFFTGIGPPTATLHYMSAYASQIRQICRSFPETEKVFQINGFSPLGPGYNALVGGMLLKPWDQRKKTQMELAKPFQQKLSKIAGLQTIGFSLPAIPGAAFGLPIQFVLTSTRSYQDLDAAANKLIAAAYKSGKFLVLQKDLRYDSPQVELRIKHNLVAALGLNGSDLATDLEPLLGGNYVNRFDLQGRTYKVIPQLKDHLRATADMLKRIYIRTASGSMIPLSTVVTIKHVVQPQFLPQFQQLNSVTISAVAAPGITMGNALNYLHKEGKKLLPTGYAFDYAAQSRQFEQQGNAIYVTFALAIILIFLLMAAQFESFRDPLIVMFTVPMSIFGAALFMFVGVATLNIYTEVGLITLIGLITKQGILIVEFANKLQENEGMNLSEAIIHASAVRLRPILMTTGAMVLGVVPLLVASGAGAVSRFDMGLMIAAGLSIGCVFSLYVIPVVYTFVASRKEKIEATAEESHPGAAH